MVACLFNIYLIENVRRRDRCDLPYTFELAHLHLDANAPAFELGIVDLGLELHEPVEVHFVDSAGFLIGHYVDRAVDIVLRGKGLDLLLDLLSYYSV